MDGIKRDGLTPGGPLAQRAAVDLSAGHPTKGKKAPPGRNNPNDYTYWGGDAVKWDRPDPVIFVFDVKMLRQREDPLLQGKSYAVLTKHPLPPECIIRIEDMDGNELYNRQQ